MLFNWLRLKVRNAVLAGVNDAVDELDHSTDATAGDMSSHLRLRLGYKVAAPTPIPDDDDATPATVPEIARGRRTR